MDTFTKEIFAIGDGFGYRIFRNGSIETEQVYRPGVPGYIVMDEEMANEMADNDIKIKSI